MESLSLPPSPRRPPVLMEELVEEILFRLPPDEPAYLVHAALVCKTWRRILSDSSFHRRYREFHRSPPLLGYIHNLYYGHDRKPWIVPVSAASIPFFSQPLHRIWLALDCRHGRVLIVNCYDRTVRLIVWDPITGGQEYLSVPNYPHNFHTGAVLCDVDGCDHLHCHGGPFRVVFVGAERVAEEYVIRASVYTSETCKWSSPTYICAESYVKTKPSLLIEDDLYFTLDGTSILRYDLSKHALSVINTPCVPGGTMIAEDGGLGLISVLDNTIFSWSLNNPSSEGAARWVQEQRFVMELGTLLPSHPSRLFTKVIGFLEGTDTIFLNSNVGLFTLNLKSRLLRKVGQVHAMYETVLPYTSFYNPDLGKG